MKEYLDDNGVHRLISDDHFNMLPEHMTVKWKLFKEALKPEILKEKENGISRGTEQSHAIDNTNGDGSSEGIGDKGISDDLVSSKTTRGVEGKTTGVKARKGRPKKVN